MQLQERKKHNSGNYAMIGLLVTGSNIPDDKDIIDAGGGIHFRKVEGLDNIEMKDNNTLTWDEVEGASEYVLKINGKKYKTKENSFDLHNLPVDSYDIKIKGTKKGYRDSSYINQKIKIYSAQEIEDNLQNAIAQKILQSDPSTRNPNVLMAKIQGNKIISFAETSRGGNTL